MAEFLTHTHYYFVGIKGVAMTALAQCLIDAGKTVSGSDVEEDFVTAGILKTLGVQIDVGFDHAIPQDVECVVYTSAHGSRSNPQVQDALVQKKAVYTHAEALGKLFNTKQGIAVCGVGGKSTTSAMVTWILEKAGKLPSFAVGVGNIPGLERTGRWRPESDIFVAEADEYVIDPAAALRGEEIVPRFRFLQPITTVCTNLKFDHPDVYRDFAHTVETYESFFAQIKKGGSLIVNGDDVPLLLAAEKVSTEKELSLVSFGESVKADLRLVKYHAEHGLTHSTWSFDDQEYRLTMQIPGKFNVMNAAGAALAAYAHGVSIEESFSALAAFRSTMRRVEFIGEKNGVRYYDDYAHHPNEVAQVIQSFREWYPDRRLVVAFQSHTFSRTKALFDDFADAFAGASQVLMIDIFPSAREAFDDTISSTMLCEAIHERFPHIETKNCHTLEKLAEYCREHLAAGDVCLTVGAGNIYNLHELL